MSQANIKTVNTGGNCMVDIITLRGGSVVVVNDEYVGAYADEAAFWDGDESSALFGAYVDGDSTLHSLQCYRAMLIDQMPDDDAARNWNRWEEFNAIDEAIAIASNDWNDILKFTNATQ